MAIAKTLCLKFLNDNRIIATSLILAVCSVTTLKLHAQNKTPHQNEQIELRISKHERQFQTGTAVVLSGFAVTAASMAVYHIQTNDYNFDGDNNNVEHKQRLIYLGGLTMAVGIGIQIDSFKHLKAKRKRKK